MTCFVFLANDTFRPWRHLRRGSGVYYHDIRPYCSLFACKSHVNTRATLLLVLLLHFSRTGGVLLVRITFPMISNSTPFFRDFRQVFGFPGLLQNFEAMSPWILQNSHLVLKTARNSPVFTVFLNPRHSSIRRSAPLSNLTSSSAKSLDIRDNKEHLSHQNRTNYNSNYQK